MKKINSYLGLLFATMLLFQIASCQKKTNSEILNLKTEGFHHWIATDLNAVKLSWTNAIPAQKELVTYEVEANFTDEKGNTTSKKIVSPLENGPHVILDLSNTNSRTKISWRVKPVYKNQVSGEWSAYFNFETGLKKSSDWKGTWIGLDKNKRKKAAVWFRKTFTVKKEIQSALLYSCGLGLHEPWINGKKIGQEVLQPAQTDYEQRSFYIVNNLTDYLTNNENTLGFWVGDGFYNQDVVWGKKGLSYGQPRILAQLEILYKDGTKEIIATNNSWLAKPSAITSSNVYAGENFNANLYDKEWASTKKTLNGWFPVIKMKSPGGKLIAQELPPCRILDTLPTKEIYSLEKNRFVYDFGQNLVGWATLKINATPNTHISIRFAEDKLSNGELNFETGGVKATKVIQTDQYICKGNGEESWEPRFSNHGFRYAEVTISNGKLINKEQPDTSLLTAKVIHTDMPITGTFNSSNEMLNKAFKMAYWTQIGSVLGVPVDCPIRERCGWTGDAHLTVPYTLYNFDAATMWQKYVNDIKTSSQKTGPTLHFGETFMDRFVKNKPKGLPTMIAPGKRTSGAASPDWGSAIAFIPWDLYTFTGDIRPLQNNYAAIKQWVNHLQSLAKGNLLYIGLGDWCKPILENPDNKKPPLFYGEMVPMLSSACYYRAVKVAADIAKVLGYTEDYTTYHLLANNIQKAYTKEFYGEQTRYTPDQTINAISIDWGVLAPTLHKEVAAKLNQQVIASNYHFMTGVFGMPSLWSVLGEFGYYTTISKTLENKTSPSIQNLIDKGATTFWEVWPLDHLNLDDYSKSMSHPFQGAFISWFYNGLAGIKPDALEPGFKLIHLQPQIIDGLDWVDCSYQSPMGLIKSAWKKEQNQWIWTLEIPAGSKAQLKIPGTPVKIEQTNGATPISYDLETTVLEAGQYTIVANL